MNYQKIYNQIINNAKNRILNKYTENHHVVPKALGGRNDESNLVLLTAKEHFIAHHLLAKIYGGKMWYAFWAMCNQHNNSHQKRKYKITASVYENAKINHIKNLKSKPGPMTGKLHSEETKRKMSQSRKGNTNAQGTPAWNKGICHTEETKDKISKANKNKSAGKHYTYVTPWGNFPNARVAKENTSHKISSWTIWYFCTNSEKVIVATNQTNEFLVEENLGKTYNDIGFSMLIGNKNEK